MKVKLTRDELKRQYDSLARFERYLPILELKKKQLQMEIIHQEELLEKKRKEEENKLKDILSWIGLCENLEVDIRSWILPQEKIYGTKNIAGIEISYLEELEFSIPKYDLFLMPLWLDYAIKVLQDWIRLREEIRDLEKIISILREELRITSQRVNLFEKVKIPEAEEAIRIIKIYLGDQMANQIARAKIAKKKLEEEEALL